MLEITGLDAFQQQVEQWIEDVSEATAHAARGMAYEAFEKLTGTGPQFSGDFVANIKLSLNVPNTMFDENAVMGARLGDYGRAKPAGEGDRAAIQYARAYASGALDGIKLGDTIFISSTAKHDDEFYSFSVENGTIKFRDVNPTARGGAYSFARTITEVGTRYSDIDSASLSKLTGRALV